jgi:hypothetical protein
LSLFWYFCGQIEGFLYQGDLSIRAIDPGMYWNPKLEWKLKG